MSAIIFQTMKSDGTIKRFDSTTMTPDFAALNVGTDLLPLAQGGSGVNAYWDFGSRAIRSSFTATNNSDLVNLLDQTTAIAAEATARNSAISSAISTEVTNRNSAISSAVAAEATARDAAILVETNNRVTAVSNEAIARDAAISTAIGTEVTNRNSAISSAISTEVTNRNAAILVETNRALAAEGVLQATISSMSTNLSWRDAVLAISADSALYAATEGTSLAGLLPFSDDETPFMTVSNFAAGDLLIATATASSPKLIKVIDDAGTLKLSYVGVPVIKVHDTFVVTNDLLDSPGANENKSIYTFGTVMSKIGSFNWGLGSGITLSVGYASSTGLVVAGDTLEVAIGKVVGNLAAEITARTTAISNEVIARDAAIAAAIATEVTNRNSAISTAIATEVTNRNTAIGVETTRAMAAEGLKADVTYVDAMDTMLNSSGTTINAGDLIYIKPDGSVAKVAKSISGLSDAILGYAEVTITTGNSGLCQFNFGKKFPGSGLVPGKEYYVSGTAGVPMLFTDITWSTGDAVYSIGRAISTTIIEFAPRYAFEY